MPVPDVMKPLQGLKETWMETRLNGVERHASESSFHEISTHFSHLSKVAEEGKMLQDPRSFPLVCIFVSPLF